jgi:hypothetical protein
MRVTKLIREYVEKTVSEKFDKQTSSEEIKLKEVEKKMATFVTEVNQQVEEVIDKAIANFLLATELPEDIKDTIVNEKPNTIGYHTYNTDIDCKARARRTERNKARDKAIENILLTLELGGTKADLDRMIAEL